MTDNAISPILAAKLRIPGFPPRYVSRPRLMALMRQGIHSKFTLISAPAKRLGDPAADRQTWPHPGDVIGVLEVAELIEYAGQAFRRNALANVASSKLRYAQEGKAFRSQRPEGLDHAVELRWCISPKTGSTQKSGQSRPARSRPGQSGRSNRGFAG